MVAETTALGAAYAAGLAVGYWKDPEDLRANWQESRRWAPRWTGRAAGGGVRGLAEGRAVHAGLGGGLDHFGALSCAERLKPRRSLATV